MANGVFNIALGKAGYYATLPAASDGLVVVLLKVAQADDTLRDHDTLAAVLAANTEADFTNYARAAAAGVVVNVNDTSNLVDADMNDITWANAGGALNNTLVKLLVCYDPATGSGTDAEIIPLTFHDFAVTTDGSSITAQVAATGFFRATG
ncbi:hypothetical protein E1264_11815 [Actinomadura sp. KC216]|uniref:hypothetical protein n=1 Tax=Actinomadura sp. KC216 TaxID=2530370 RepID=UPI0010532F62|nr:hypothetical protein [Actinomadura sp. KC216]TDB88361.1 hypothetical protein E1264_11815 [Actinomadura sp. KC216]